MTTETALTDKQIIDILERNRPDYDGLDKAISVSRDIEQAVLQSPEVQMALEDTKRLDWLADPDNTIGNVQLPTECVTNNLGSLRGAIDDARGMKP